jgi:hypothetical protein
VAISLQNLVSAGAEILLTHGCFQSIDFLKETEIARLEVDSGDWDVCGAMTRTNAVACFTLKPASTRLSTRLPDKPPKAVSKKLTLKAIDNV